MIFTSVDYALLLTATFLAYWWLPGRWARAVLLGASVVFYAHWSVPFLALLGASTGVAYASALAIERARNSSLGGARTSAGRIALVLALATLLGSLALFKYANFFLDTFSFFTGTPRQVVEIVLPLAISFYTFQILGYVIDVYRGAKAERSFSRFALFTIFFPQLVAGPIARAHQLLPQLRKRSSFDWQRVLTGLELLAYGVVKKAVFADNFAVLVDRVYGNPDAASGIDVAIATLAFGAQIYCDFSGYTDIARGSGRILGIELPINFRWPYLAANFTDFWRRWHITLSSWLRDYLYIPLGGNRRRVPRVYANVLITMALGGLWHGASVTFVLWGLYHGLLLVAERALRLHHPASIAAPLRPLMLAVTFVSVQIGWAIFRAEDLATLSALVSRLAEDPLGRESPVGSLAYLTMGREPPVDSLAYLPLLGAFYCLHALSAFVRPRSWLRQALGRVEVAVPVLTVAIVLAVVFGGRSEAFIYFQF